MSKQYRIFGTRSFFRRLLPNDTPGNGSLTWSGSFDLRILGLRHGISGGLCLLGGYCFPRWLVQIPCVLGGGGRPHCFLTLFCPCIL